MQKYLPLDRNETNKEVPDEKVAREDHQILNYLKVIKSWGKDLPNLMTYLKYSIGRRKYIYTTDSLEGFKKRSKQGKKQ